ncbi:hypothetical protein [Roseobacter sp. HKCCA0434]|uniref:hypothetical protein n=1 Tax=Roseobacter sp. HKCCA0434 TaxID=3079297 RepID=UPI002905CA13|nr:hypothetical protein [Roseobacter sp. HKCCA0434]
MRRGPGYTRFVRWSKILLPLAAVVLLSTIFLIDQDRIDFDEGLLGAVPEGVDFDEGVLSPRLAGTTSDGTPYAFEAEFALPSEGAYRLQDISGRLERVDDPVELTAGEGAFDPDTDLLELSGGIDLRTGSGNSISTSIARIGLADRSLLLPEDVEVRFEGGELRADSARTGDGAEADMIWFEGDVRISIQPNAD